MDLFDTGRRIGDFLGHLFKIVRGLQQARLLRFDSAGDVGQLLLSVPGHQDTSAGDRLCNLDRDRRAGCADRRNRHIP